MLNGQTLLTGNARASIKVRKNDLYQTPPEAVHALLTVEDVPTRIWEPACGPGAIVRVLREYDKQVWATDLVDYSSSDQDVHGLDFMFNVEAKDNPHDIDAIITNPPFKLAEKFVSLSLKRAPYVAMLLRLAFMESDKRSDILDSGQLARVHVFRKRIPMMHRERFEGKRTMNSGMAFAWFVWERDHTGPTELHRLSWQPLT